MLGFQEVYTLSVINDSICLWPDKIFRYLRKAYLFEETWVMERRSIQDAVEAANEAKEKYVIIPDPADTGLIMGIFNRGSGIGIFNKNLLPKEVFSSVEKKLIDGEDKDRDWHMEFLYEKQHALLQLAKSKLLKARQYNDEIRKIRDSVINEKELKAFTDELKFMVFRNRTGSAVQPSIDRAFFGTNAALGPFFMTHFHDAIERCFIIKGEGSSFTSSILSNMAKEAATKGYDTFLYYCPFYTDELDCVVIPELKTAIMESEEPHEIEPLHPNEIVMSVFETCLRKEALFSYALELRELEAKYKQHMRQAVLDLQDYGKYKRQELAQKDHSWNADTLLSLIN